MTPTPPPPSLPCDTVYVVDDDASVRDSLSLMLSLKGFATATFGNAEDFLATARPDWKGCVLADIRMPGMSGLDLLDEVRQHFPELAVVVVTAHGDVAAARRAFLAEAADFVEKPFDSSHILAAIANASARRAAQAGRAPRVPRGRLPGEVLTGREQEVLALLMRGLHNRQIAAQLGISPRTVEVHKARVMEKLGVSSMVELVRLHDGPAT
ncbi:response regulator transcription factor [Ramlibacter sp. AN1133]|uniref:response regulator transcription factor n=1 Tax=Ramlibacter sp. AN1133 TaxID=3133429 RepID=UPI0030BDD6C5